MTMHGVPASRWMKITTQIHQTESDAQKRDTPESPTHEPQAHEPQAHEPQLPAALGDSPSLIELLSREAPRHASPCDAPRLDVWQPDAPRLDVSQPDALLDSAPLAEHPEARAEGQDEAVNATGTQDEQDEQDEQGKADDVDDADDADDEPMPKLDHIYSGAELMRKQFAPKQWAIRNLICQGLSILAAPPKAGKSFLMLQAALAVAHGHRFCGFETTRGNVLYLALEDPEQRLQERIRALGYDNTALLQYAHTEESEAFVSAAGIARMEEWIANCDNPRLIIVDILERVRPAPKGRGNAYREDYDSLREIKRLADANNVAIVLVHHTSKRPSRDPFAAINGTNGLIGAVDDIAVMQVEGGETTLRIKGRNIESAAYRLERDGAPWLRAVEIDDEGQPVSENYRPVLELLLDHPGLRPMEVGKALGLKDVTARQQLLRLKDDGFVVSGPKYRYELTEDGARAIGATLTGAELAEEAAEAAAEEVPDGALSRSEDAGDGEEPPADLLLAA